MILVHTQFERKLGGFIGVFLSFFFLVIEKFLSLEYILSLFYTVIGVSYVEKV